MSMNVASDVMAEVDRQRAQIAAENRVRRMVQLQTPHKRYSVRSLALMSIGRGALIAADRHTIAEARHNAGR